MLFVLFHFLLFVVERLFIWRFAFFNLVDAVGNDIDQKRIEPHLERFDYAVFIEHANSGNGVDFQFLSQIPVIVANAVRRRVPLL